MPVTECLPDLVRKPRLGLGVPVRAHRGDVGLPCPGALISRRIGIACPLRRPPAPLQRLDGRLRSAERLSSCVCFASGRSILSESEEHEDGGRGQAKGERG